MVNNKNLRWSVKGRRSICWASHPAVPYEIKVGCVWEVPLGFLYYHDGSEAADDFVPYMHQAKAAIEARAPLRVSAESVAFVPDLKQINKAEKTVSSNLRKSRAALLELEF